MSPTSSASNSPPSNVPDDGFGAHSAQPFLSQLDDVFDCSTQPGVLHEGQEHAVAPHTHVSDIPRLRNVHVTAGYRDGIAESKARHVQAGFDEGFPLGAVMGLKVGWVLGVLEGIIVAFGAAVQGKAKTVDVGHAAVMLASVREQVAEARKELDMSSLFAQAYFDEDGVWKYHVKGQEGEVTFEDVAVQHPVIAKWLTTVNALAKENGIDLGILQRRTKHDPHDETAMAD